MKNTIVNRFVREEECHFMTGLSRTTRWRLERTGNFPKRRKLSVNTIGWMYSEIVDWMNATGKAVA